MLELLRFSFCILLCVPTVYLQGCTSHEEITIVIDSTKLTTAKDFAGQKLFVEILCDEIQLLTNLSLTVQVYSKKKACQRLLIDEYNRAFRSANGDEIKSKLSSLSHDNKSDTTYNVTCVKEFVKGLPPNKIHENEVGSGSAPTATSSLILAKYDSVKEMIGGGRIPAGESTKDYLVFFLTTNGKEIKEPFVRKISDIQNFVSAIKKLICNQDNKIKNQSDSAITTTKIVTPVFHLNNTVLPLSTSRILNETKLRIVHETQSINPTQKDIRGSLSTTQLHGVVSTSSLSTTSSLIFGDVNGNKSDVTSENLTVLKIASVRRFSLSSSLFSTPSIPSSIPTSTTYKKERNSPMKVIPSSVLLIPTASNTKLLLQTSRLPIPSSSIPSNLSSNVINVTTVLSKPVVFLTSLPSIRPSSTPNVTDVLPKPYIKITPTVFSSVLIVSNSSNTTDNINPKTVLPTVLIINSSSLPVNTSNLINMTAKLPTTLFLSSSSNVSNATFLPKTDIRRPITTALFTSLSSLPSNKSNIRSTAIAPGAQPTSSALTTSMITSSLTSNVSSKSVAPKTKVLFTPTPSIPSNISNVSHIVIVPKTKLHSTVLLTSSPLVAWKKSNSTNIMIDSSTKLPALMTSQSLPVQLNLSPISSITPRPETPTATASKLNYISKNTPSIEKTKVLSAIMSMSSPVIIASSPPAMRTSIESVMVTPILTRVNSAMISVSTTFLQSNIATGSVILPTISSSLITSNTTVVVTPIIPEHPLKRDLKMFQEQKISEDSFENSVWVQSFVDKASNIMEKLNADNSSEVMAASKPLVRYVEEIMLKVGKAMSTSEQKKFNSNGLIVEINAVDPANFDGYQFSEDGDATSKEGIDIPNNIFPPDYTAKSAAIVAMKYKPLPVMKPISTKNTIADNVFVVSIDPPIPSPFKEPFNYTMTVYRKSNINVKCVFWNDTDWLSRGCNTFASNNSSSVTCQCDHMTPFSVLMQVNEFEIPDEHVFALSLITYIGCGLSIFGCIVLILAFMMCGKLIKIDRNLIHINLAIAIALSNGLFIIADSVYKFKYVCLGVSIAMLYSFLSSFFWMLVEGMHVYLMVVKVFHSTRKMKVYMLIGWVIPAIIVTLAGLKFHEDFIRPNFCWITTDRSLIWVFVGPALFVLSVNTVILIASLSASHKMCIDEFEFNRLRKIARLTLVLMPIFGLSWVFGVLAVNKELLIFQYIFTGLNSFQGVFLFVCYCLMNSEVKREYQRVRRRSHSSSKSNGLADSGFSSYVHYQRGKPSRSSALSTDDAHVNVYLTKFDPHDDFMTYEEEPDTEYPESVSNTLTKKTHKKNYSIELLRLPKTVGGSGGSGDDEDRQSYEESDATGLLRVVDDGQRMYRSSSFHSSISKNRGSALFDDFEQDNEGGIYKTFQNTNDGTFVTAYQV